MRCARGLPVPVLSACSTSKHRSAARERPRIPTARARAARRSTAKSGRRRGRAFAASRTSPGGREHAPEVPEIPDQPRQQDQRLVPGREELRHDPQRVAPSRLLEGLRQLPVLAGSGLPRERPHDLLGHAAVLARVERGLLDLGRQPARDPPPPGRPAPAPPRGGGRARRHAPAPGASRAAARPAGGAHLDLVRLREDPERRRPGGPRPRPRGARSCPPRASRPAPVAPRPGRRGAGRRVLAGRSPTPRTRTRRRPPKSESDAPAPTRRVGRELVGVKDLAIPVGGRLIVRQEGPGHALEEVVDQERLRPVQQEERRDRPAAASRRRAVTSSSEPFEGEADDRPRDVHGRPLDGLLLAGQGLRHLPGHQEVGPLLDPVLLPDDPVLLEIPERQGETDDQPVRGDVGAAVERQRRPAGTRRSSPRDWRPPRGRWRRCGPGCSGPRPASGPA